MCRPSAQCVRYFAAFNVTTAITAVPIDPNLVSTQLMGKTMSSGQPFAVLMDVDNITPVNQNFVLYLTRIIPMGDIFQFADALKSAFLTVNSGRMLYPLLLV